MSDQQGPGFYAVGDEDTFFVSPGGQVFEVARGGMEGPVLARVDALPPGEQHVMAGALILPSLLLQAARARRNIPAAQLRAGPATIIVALGDRKPRRDRRGRGAPGPGRLRLGRHPRSEPALGARRH